ncbi:F-box protein [Corchorus olitorius]|uniref:F-box protein n=1 Tax=Corchorus olitorius TaxID=93759 RepID=A0A1R3IN12_9ROSI|nr:F-box protein [Corchorus olitorius]
MGKKARKRNRNQHHQKEWKEKRDFFEPIPHQCSICQKILTGLDMAAHGCHRDLCQGKYYCLDKTGNLLTFDPTNVDGSFKCIQNKDGVECTDDEDGVESCTEEEDCVESIEAEDGTGDEDIEDEDIRPTLTFDISPLLGEGGYQTFMVENDGDLLAIFITQRGRRVYVYKWDESHRNFGSVKSLGDNMVFVSYGGAFSQKAVLRGTGNKIYFPTFFHKNGAYAFYSLATKRYHSFVTSFSRAYGISGYMQGVWFSSGNRFFPE